MRTEIDIINRAILKNHVFNQELESDDGTLEEATGDESILRIARQFYPESRKQVFRVAAWTCLMAREKLTEADGDNFTGYAFKMALPEDYIRQVEVTDTFGKLIDFTIEGAYLYTDDPGPILTYIPDDENPEHWDPLLAEVVCTQFASAIAYPLTGDHQNEIAFAQAAAQMIYQAVNQTTKERSQGAKMGVEWFPGLFNRTPSTRL